MSADSSGLNMSEQRGERPRLQAVALDHPEPRTCEGDAERGLHVGTLRLASAGDRYKPDTVTGPHHDEIGSLDVVTIEPGEPIRVVSSARGNG